MQLTPSSGDTGGRGLLSQLNTKYNHGKRRPGSRKKWAAIPKTVDSLLDRVSMNSNADGVESGEEHDVAPIFDPLVERNKPAFEGWGVQNIDAGQYISYPHMHQLLQGSRKNEKYERAKWLDAHRAKQHEMRQELIRQSERDDTIELPPKETLEDEEAIWSEHWRLRLDETFKAGAASIDPLAESAEALALRAREGLSSCPLGGYKVGCAPAPSGLEELSMAA